MLQFTAKLDSNINLDHLRAASAVLADDTIGYVCKYNEERRAFYDDVVSGSRKELQSLRRNIRQLWQNVIDEVLTDSSRFNDGNVFLTADNSARSIKVSLRFGSTAYGSLNINYEADTPLVTTIEYTTKNLDRSEINWYELKDLLESPFNAIYSEFAKADKSRTSTAAKLIETICEYKAVWFNEISMLESKQITDEADVKKIMVDTIKSTLEPMLPSKATGDRVREIYLYSPFGYEDKDGRWHVNRFYMNTQTKKKLAMRDPVILFHIESIVIDVDGTILNDKKHTKYCIWIESKKSEIYNALLFHKLFVPENVAIENAKRNMNTDKDESKRLSMEDSDYSKLFSEDIKIVKRIETIVQNNN